MWQMLCKLAHIDNFAIPFVQEPAAGCLSLLCLEKDIRDKIIRCSSHRISVS